MSQDLVLAALLTKIREDTARSNNAAQAAVAGIRSLSSAGSPPAAHITLASSPLVGRTGPFTQGRPELSLDMLAALQSASESASGSAITPSPLNLLNYLASARSETSAVPLLPQHMGDVSAAPAVAAEAQAVAKTPVSETGEVVDSSVRKEAVEAALRSKPQRGRKRENLTHSERAELTRTRNREHAKSTRLRKKMKQQELETKLQEMEDTHELNERRRTCIVHYLKARENMIRTVTRCGESTESDGTPKAGTASSKPPLALDCVVGSLQSFVYDDGTKSDGDSTALDKMRTFDENLALRVETLFGSARIQSMEVSLLGTTTSIAFSAENTAFADVCVSLTATRLVTAVHRFDFLPDSDKLRGVSWTTKDDYLDEGSSERLNGQVSHPSVVSLDRGIAECCDKSAPESDEKIKCGADAGPGMNLGDS